MAKSYYAVLGVSPDAEAEVIRAAFKALMMKYHPDTNREAGADAKAKQINEAYGILSDAAKRRSYDAELKARRENSAGSAQAGSRAGSTGSQGDGAKAASPPPPPPPRQPAYTPSTPEPQRTWRTRVAQWAGVAIVLIAGRLVFTGVQANSGPPEIDTGRTEQSMPAPDVVPVETAPPVDTSVQDQPIRKAVDEMDRVLRTSGILGAADYSRKCFAEVAKSRTWQKLDFCVAFDLVARDVDDTVSQNLGADRLSYFDEQRSTERHQAALRQLSGNAYSWDFSRLTDVKDRTQEQMRRFLVDQEKAEEAKAAQQAALNSIPSPFHGEWNENLAACGTGLDTSALRVGATELNFYESTAKIERVVTKSARKVTIEAAMAGEGETWSSTIGLSLGPGGDVLTTSIDSEGLTLLRCGSEKRI